MQTMINDLLAISMISGNKSFEPYSLQKIWDETVQTLEYKIEQKNAIIKANKLPGANIIPSQFRQLFQNLLSNSLNTYAISARTQNVNKKKKRSSRASINIDEATNCDTQSHAER